MAEPQGLSDAARDIMMRGGVPGNATQWVARVAKGLEAHYRTLQREDGVRIAKLESRLVRQEHELAEVMDDDLLKAHREEMREASATAKVKLERARARMYREVQNKEAQMEAKVAAALAQAEALAEAAEVAQLAQAAAEVEAQASTAEAATEKKAREEVEAEVARLKQEVAAATAASLAAPA